MALLQMELYADRRRLHVSLRLQALAASRQGLQGFPASEQGLTFDRDESKKGQRDTFHLNPASGVWAFAVQFIQKKVTRNSQKTENMQPGFVRATLTTTL